MDPFVPRKDLGEAAPRYHEEVALAEICRSARNPFDGHTPMSLIPCPECQTEVSDQATACPRCGHPVRREILRQEMMRQQVEPKDEGANLLQTICSLLLAAAGAAMLIYAVTKQGPMTSPELVVGGGGFCLFVAGLAWFLWSRHWGRASA